MAVHHGTFTPTYTVTWMLHGRGGELGRGGGALVISSLIRHSDNLDDLRSLQALSKTHVIHNVIIMYGGGGV